MPLGCNNICELEVVTNFLPFTSRSPPNCGVVSETKSANPPVEDPLIHPLPASYLRTCPGCGDDIVVSVKPSKVLDPPPPPPPPVAVALKIPAAVIVNPVPTLNPPKVSSVAIGKL